MTHKKIVDVYVTITKTYPKCKIMMNSAYLKDISHWILLFYCKIVTNWFNYIGFKHGIHLFLSIIEEEFEKLIRTILFFPCSRMQGFTSVKRVNPIGLTGLTSLTNEKVNPVNPWTSLGFRSIRYNHCT